MFSDIGDSIVYYVYAEKRLMNSTSVTFADALCQLFALYFNFNMMYPEKTTKTFLFIQREMAEYYTETTRAKKMHQSKKATVVNFISKLNKFTFEQQ
jgi:hypothetical protein